MEILRTNKVGSYNFPYDTCRDKQTQRHMYDTIYCWKISKIGQL